MSVEYPAAIINKARELYLTPVEGAKRPWRSYEVVARLINGEFNTSVPKKTIFEWARQYGWVRPDQGGVSTATPDLPALTPADPAVRNAKSAVVASVQHGQVALTGDWDWEHRKAVFLANLSGIAETCIATDPNGILVFKDHESQIKTGLAAIEMIGKLQSGKFDKTEKGDFIPVLNESEIKAALLFFTDPSAPTPRIAAANVIDVEFSEGASADHN
jgi:hypothetical protein